MDPQAMVGIAIALGLAAAKVVDKAWPTRADAYLENISSSMKQMLHIQREMHSDAKVDRERMSSAIKAIDKIEQRIEKHMVEEDAVHNSIVEHITRFAGGVNT